MIDGCKSRQFDQVGLREVACFGRRLRPSRLGSECIDRAHRLDAEDVSILAVELAASEDHARGLGFLDLAVLITLEDHAFIRVKPMIGKTEAVRGDFFKRVIEEPLDKGVQLAVLFEDVEDVVVPTVFADQIVPSSRRLERSFASGCFSRCFVSK